MKKILLHWIAIPAVLIAAVYLCGFGVALLGNFAEPASLGGSIVGSGSRIVFLIGPLLYILFRGLIPTRSLVRRMGKGIPKGGPIEPGGGPGNGSDGMWILLFLVIAYLLCWLAIFTGFLNSALLKRYNFFVLLTCVVAVFQTAIRPAKIRLSNWKRLLDIWLKFPTYPAIAIGAIGFLGQLKISQADIVGVGVGLGYIKASWILLSYLLGVATFILASIASRLGRASVADDKTNDPWPTFLFTFFNSWISNVLLWTLSLEGVFLAYIYFRHLGV